MVHLDYRDSRPIYAQIVDGFREQITGGVLRPGEKLPSVRDLAAQLAINPNTIQRAYRRLEAEVDRHRAGKGLLCLRRRGNQRTGEETAAAELRRSRRGAADHGREPRRAGGQNREGRP